MRRGILSPLSTPVPVRTDLSTELRTDTRESIRKKLGYVPQAYKETLGASAADYASPPEWR